LHQLLDLVGIADDFGHRLDVVAAQFDQDWLAFDEVEFPPACARVSSVLPSRV
jgi:hypothetical protein